ncbi:Transmembrane protein, putative [Perkinsus marinus ATCC 50983]|uniref:Transmembrane protein, putative n=1 Tax=Perkinsus marinus (strain ATCC 50983 / TXsc) TaxID=423536 RepID=C5KL77_PERM5|nr:Transmembrane protein, putative [Perkinsus marinus ATCC 50983]EER14750.1 Transmembrane protein, putative [Perkinsus marinus ATCC 50983]|eukprot:XP_002782954.1 Transmembrane protein, putative [Perkinsus marinus ATCC 50983]
MEADNLQGWVIIRGVFGALSNWILYYSLSQLPLADSSSLFFTQPMFTLILAPLVINESIAPRQVLAVLMAVCGVFCIARPAWLFGAASASTTAVMHNIDPQIPRWLAVIVCLSGSFVASLVFITVTHIGKRAHWAQLVFSFAAFGTAVAIIPLCFQWSPLRMPSTPWPYVMLFSLGCCALLGQSTFNHGIQLCQSAVTSSLVRQVDLIFAFVYQALFLNHPLTWYSLTGGFFVLCGALVDALPKLVTELKSRGYIGVVRSSRKVENV